MKYLTDKHKNKQIDKRKKQTNSSGQHLAKKVRTNDNIFSNPELETPKLI